MSEDTGKPGRQVLVEFHLHEIRGVATVYHGSNVATPLQTKVELALAHTALPSFPPQFEKLDERVAPYVPTALRDAPDESTLTTEFPMPPLPSFSSSLQNLPWGNQIQQRKVFSQVHTVNPALAFNIYHVPKVPRYNHPDIVDGSDRDMPSIIFVIDGDRAV